MARFTAHKGQTLDFLVVHTEPHVFEVVRPRALGVHCTTGFHRTQGSTLNRHLWDVAQLIEEANLVQNPCYY